MDNEPMNRRVFFTNASLLALSAGLVACGTTATTPTTVSTAATSAAAIASGLQAAIAALQASGVTVPASVTNDLALLQTDASVIASATAPATTTAQEIEDMVEAIADIVLPLVPGGSGIEVLVNAAISLAPSLVSMVGSLQANAVTVPRHAAVYSPGMALALLQQAKTLAAVR